MEIPYNGEDDDCNEATVDDDLDGDGFPIETTATMKMQMSIPRLLKMPIPTAVMTSTMTALG